MSRSGNVSPLHRLTPPPTSKSVDYGSSRKQTTLYPPTEYRQQQPTSLSTGPTLYSEPNHRFDPYYVRPSMSPESPYTSDPGWSPSPSPFEQPPIQRHRWSHDETRKFLDSLAQYMRDQKYKNARDDPYIKFSEELFWDRFVEYMKITSGRALTKLQYSNRLKSLNERYDAVEKTERSPMLEQAHRLDKAHSIVVEIEQDHLTQEDLDGMAELPHIEKKIKSLASSIGEAPTEEITAKETEELHKQGERFKTRVEDMQTQFDKEKGKLDEDKQKQLREDIGHVERNFAALDNEVEAIIKKLQCSNTEKSS